MEKFKPPYKYICREINRHGTEVLYFRRGAGPRYRLPLDFDSQEFKDAYSAAMLRDESAYYPEFIPITEHRKKAINQIVRKAISRAKMKCSEKNIDFDLDYEWAVSNLENQEYKCPLSGVCFTTNNDSQSFMRPFIPSLDRINPQGGYIKDNTRLITFALNAMLSDWGEDIFHKTANGYRYQLLQRRKDAAFIDPKPAPSHAGAGQI